MNDLAREKLIDAAMRGVRQIRGRYRDGKGGFCALGVLGFAGVMDQGLDEFMQAARDYDMDSERRLPCPHECGTASMIEDDLVVHLNDDHGDDFLTIARKL